MVRKFWEDLEALSVEKISLSPLVGTFVSNYTVINIYFFLTLIARMRILQNPAKRFEKETKRHEMILVDQQDSDSTYELLNQY